MLEATGIRFAHGRTPILHDVSFAVTPGEVVAVLGPNGAGKSTLLAILSGALTPGAGEVRLETRPLAQWQAGALARRRAVLPQNAELTFPFRVTEVVLLGRSPHAGISSRETDLQAVKTALMETESGHLADRIYTTLSGGERQRVQLARVLAQIAAPPGEDTPTPTGRYLLLDEPTSSLDLAHQHATLETARRMALRGTGVVAILHDLNLAAMYADRIMIMRDGRVAGDGPPAEVLTETTVRDAFDLPVHITRHPSRDCPHVIAI